ncbi:MULTISPECIES: hypothetical protein [Citrobacter]|uniref:Uncharacterized protein n=1 Tax=Citrobacter cronae TaxID=1748967 RepID=A0A7X1BQW0_9ENTR|nr:MULTISPECIES: hypothetical protein [Citrobacter]MBS6074064.1 hypothetical protein [Citrobacter freundii]MBC2621460.1 hypothetical protein [Citrobacter cronae]MBJ8363424.1 hypothetical protein [Citrobacter cronae]MBJ8371779.1 hypothetical protein [Citrobacter cronae]MBJ8378074.1 hypothetical protein [Citrobacter cronae]
MAVFLHKQNGKFSANNHTEAPFIPGKNGMKCRQDGMKCLDCGMNDETKSRDTEFYRKS